MRNIEYIETEKFPNEMVGIRKNEYFLKFNESVVILA